MRLLDGFGFEEKRLAFEALSVQVVANVREWEVCGAISLGKDGAASATCRVAPSLSRCGASAAVPFTVRRAA